MSKSKKVQISVQNSREIDQQVKDNSIILLFKHEGKLLYKAIDIENKSIAKVLISLDILIESARSSIRTIMLQEQKKEKKNAEQ